MIIENINSKSDKNNGDDNIFNKISSYNIDVHSLFNQRFILRYHQVLPKYFLLANKESNSYLINYSLGSGKTVTAVFTFLHVIKHNVDIDSINAFMNIKKHKKKVAIVGQWQTEAQFRKELSRSCFNIINKETWKRIRSGDKNAQAILKTIDKIINNDILYYGYQTFFKAIINIFSKKFVQDINTLYDMYNKNALSFNTSFLESLCDSYVVIDEVQRLYNQAGLNTYGFAATILAKYAKQYNITIILLTGTPFNNSIMELKYLEQILSGTVEIDNTMDDEFFKPHNISSFNIYELTDIGQEYYSKFLSNKYFYYNQNDYEETTEMHPKFLKIPVDASQYVKSESPINIHMHELQNNIFIPSIIKSLDNIRALVLPYSKNLPQVLFIGNCEVSNKNCSSLPLNLCCLDMQGYQNKTFIDFYSRKKVTDIDAVATTEETEEDGRGNFGSNRISKFGDMFEEVGSGGEDVNNSISAITTIAVDNKVFSSTPQGIYNASCFDTFTDDSLKNYSILFYTLVKLCIENSKNNEKTVIHTSKINNLGINQLKLLFKINGYVEYGNHITDTSRCKICLKCFKDHVMETHKFFPMFMSELSGTQTQAEREHITNKVYNHNRNLTGDLISVLFISDVAYSGVSLRATHNICIIDLMPNISKWQQIYSRIVRTHSHSYLPFAKRYAKVYTFIAKSTEEENVKDSFCYLYYNIKYMQNEYNQRFIKEMKDQSINACMSDPKRSKKYIKSLPEETIDRLESYFKLDVINELFNATEYIFDNNNSNYWYPATLLKKIRDNNSSNSFIDFRNIDDNFILTTLLRYNIVEYYGDVLVTTKSFQETLGFKDIGFNRNVEDLDESNIIPADTFNGLSEVSIEDKYIKEFLEVTQKSHKKRLTNIIINKIFINNFSKLKTVEPLWRYLYELGTEYYNDDEENFVKNHATANRSYERMKGFYNNNMIIIKETGECRIIKPEMISNNDKFSDIYFTVLCTKTNSGDQFNLRVIVNEKINNKNITDRRRIVEGVSCNSYDLSKLKGILTRIDYNLPKTKICSDIVRVVCDYQLEHPEKKSVITPFEYYTNRVLVERY